MPLGLLFHILWGVGQKTQDFVAKKGLFFEKAAYLWLFFALFLLFIGTYYGQNTAADAEKYKIGSRYSYI